MIRLLAFRQPRTLMDRAIMAWTRSPYSHVELEVGGLRYAARPGIGVVADAGHVDPDTWDAIAVPSILLDQLRLDAWCRCELGKRYDWAGLSIAAFGWGWESRNRWFCSEFAAAGLRAVGVLPDDGRRPASFTPGSLVAAVRRLQF